MKCTVRKSDNLSDWYVIERAEHDGREWLAPISGGMAFMRSARISDADVEGTAEEMLAIADAIQGSEDIEFKRCAIRWQPNGFVEVWSPRNSMRPERISGDDARHLATEIRRVVR